MELKIAAPELARALGRSQGIVEKKTTMPILSHVLLEAKGKNALHISATDLDVSISSEHECEVAKEGAVAVPAKHLYEIVRALPDNVVSLRKTHNNYLEVKSGPSEFRIVGLPPDDFPVLPKFEKVPFVSVDPAALLDQIDRTAFAVSSDETRYNLNGVFFEPSQGVLRLVATDGHRLSLSERAAPGDFALKRGVILPRKGLHELRKLLQESIESGKEKPEGRFGFVDNAAIFGRTGVVLAMRLIEGLFPDYKQVIPKQAGTHVKVGRDALLATLRRVSLLSADKAHGVRIELDGKTMKVSSQNSELGEAKEELTVDYDGGPLKIGFNARYLQDVLGAVRSDDVLVEMESDLSPGVIKGADAEKDGGFTAVVMPMRI
jgi:DNA polymerase-3 subunit beta